MAQINPILNDQISLTKGLMEIACGTDSFFKPCRVLFDAYWKKLQKLKPQLVTNQVNDYSGEALTRFWQLDFLIAKITTLENSIEQKRQDSILNGNPVENWLKENAGKITLDLPVNEGLRRVLDVMKNTEINELQLYTECFYFVAHRLRKIIEYYPGLKEFEPTGVINVRNNLIEHPHGKNGITMPSFGVNEAKGPTIKPGKRTNEENKTIDEGLHRNAAEFRNLLENVLKKALELLNN